MSTAERMFTRGKPQTEEDSFKLTGVNFIYSETQSNRRGNQCPSICFHQACENQQGQPQLRRAGRNCCRPIRYHTHPDQTGLHRCTGDREVISLGYRLRVALIMKSPSALKSITRRRTQLSDAKRLRMEPGRIEGEKGSEIISSSDPFLKRLLWVSCADVGSSAAVVETKRFTVCIKATRYLRDSHRSKFKLVMPSRCQLHISKTNDPTVAAR